MTVANRPPMQKNLPLILANLATLGLGAVIMNCSSSETTTTCPSGSTLDTAGTCAPDPHGGSASCSVTACSGTACATTSTAGCAPTSTSCSGCSTGCSNCSTGCGAPPSTSTTVGCGIG